jgi:hypothetical protein
MMPPWLILMSLRSCEHARSLFVAGVSFQYCLQASNTTSPIANLSVKPLVVVTTGCMVLTHASHFWQGVSSTTGGAGGAGRGWQVLMVLQESWPALQLQTWTVMSDEHIDLLESVLQSESLKQVPGCMPASR